MLLYSSIDSLAQPGQAPEDLTATVSPSQPSGDLNKESRKGPLSFVVDLGEMGLHSAYRAYEIHRGSQCRIFARVGPEYVNPYSGAKEQASWIL